MQKFYMALEESDYLELEKDIKQLNKIIWEDLIRKCYELGYRKAMEDMQKDNT